MVLHHHKFDEERNSEVECYWVLGQRVEFLTTGETTGGAFSLIRIFLPSNFPSPPPHRHTDAEESFYLLTGQVEVFVEGVWQPLNINQVVTVPRGKLHTFRSVGLEEAEILVWLSPAGFESFFRDFGHPTNPDDKIPPAITEADIQRLLAVANRYNLEIPV